MSTLACSSCGRRDVVVKSFIEVSVCLSCVRDAVARDAWGAGSCASCGLEATARALCVLPKVCFCCECVNSIGSFFDAVDLKEIELSLVTLSDRVRQLEALVVRWSHLPSVEAQVVPDALEQTIAVAQAAEKRMKGGESRQEELRLILGLIHSVHSLALEYVLRVFPPTRPSKRSSGAN